MAAAANKGVRFIPCHEIYGACSRSEAVVFWCSGPKVRVFCLFACVQRFLLSAALYARARLLRRTASLWRLRVAAPGLGAEPPGRFPGQRPQSHDGHAQRGEPDSARVYAPAVKCRWKCLSDGAQTRQRVHRISSLGGKGLPPRTGALKKRGAFWRGRRGKSRRDASRDKAAPRGCPRQKPQRQGLEGR